MGGKFERNSRNENEHLEGLSLKSQFQWIANLNEITAVKMNIWKVYVLNRNSNGLQI